MVFTCGAIFGNELVKTWHGPKYTKASIWM